MFGKNETPSVGIIDSQSVKTTQKWINATYSGNMNVTNSDIREVKTEMQDSFLQIINEKKL